MRHVGRCELIGGCATEGAWLKSSTIGGTKDLLASTEWEAGLGDAFKGRARSAQIDMIARTDEPVELDGADLPSAADLYASSSLDEL